MSDKLKKYIDAHRESFDDLEPGNLWPKLDTEIKQLKPSSTHLNIIKSMLKYGFGASALVVGTLWVTTTFFPKENVHSSESRELKDSIAQPSMAPKLNPGAVLQTEIKTEAPETKQETLKKNTPLEYSYSGDSEPLAQTIPSGTEQVQHQVTSGTNQKTYEEIKKQDTSYIANCVQVDTLFKGVKRLEVKGEYCAVTIKAVETSGVHFRGKVGAGGENVIVFGRKSYKNRNYVIRYEQDGELLKVWIEHEDLKHRVRVQEGLTENSVLDFEVPVSTDILVNNASGDVQVAGIRSPHTSLKTSYGNIKVQDLASDLTLKSSSGNISLINVNGHVSTENSYGDLYVDRVNGDLKALSSSGDITLKNITGNVEATSSYGFQRYEAIHGNVVSISASGDLLVKKLEGNINAKSSYGKESYEDVEGDIYAQVSSGDIEINRCKGSLSLATSYGDISAKYLRLASSSEFKTSSGDIKISLLNELKDLSFDLRSNTGNLLVEKENVKNSADKRLSLGQGSILITGISSYGDQIYK